MRILLGVFLILGGIGGVGISLLGDVTLTSTAILINGLELSLVVGLFSSLAVLGGIYLLLAG